MTNHESQPANATTSAQPSARSIETDVSSQPLVPCPRCHYAIVDLTRDCPECGLAPASLELAYRQFQAGVPYRPWLHRFALLFVVSTFVLIILGGTVTSKGAGLAVPDWPSTFNYNMFLFPPSMWVGGIFWEHTHRLMGSLVGLMAIIMCIWLWQTNTKPESDEIESPQSPRTPVRVCESTTRPWLKYLGVATLIMVIIQGLMGGLRVTQLSIWLAVFHGITAQIFVCMTVLIAAATSRWWVQKQQELTTTGQQNIEASATATPNAKNETRNHSLLLRPAAIALIALFIQLTLGATMRHHGAGLAIPDFPLSYGGLIPPLTQPAIEQAMIEYSETPDTYATTEHGWYTPFHVAIHWSHRLWAIAVIIALDRLIRQVMRNARGQSKLTFLAGAVGVLLLLQIALGASTIWTGRHPEVATAHQTLGAILLATTALLFFRIKLLASLQEGEPARASQLDTPRSSKLELQVTLESRSLRTQGAGS